MWKSNPPIFTHHKKTVYALQGSAEETWHELERLGVTRRVKEPTDWVSPCQFVPKKNGGARLVTDLMGLNKFVKRRVHLFTPAKDLLALIPNTAKVFAVFYLKHGYLQIPQKSQLLTTFLTEWGTWCYQRLPMGLICSGDEFCERTNQALTGLIGILKLVWYTCLCWYGPGARGEDRTIVQTLLGASNHFSRRQNSSWFRSTIWRLCSKWLWNKTRPCKDWSYSTLSWA